MPWYIKSGLKEIQYANTFSVLLQIVTLSVWKTENQQKNIVSILDLIAQCLSRLAQLVDFKFVKLTLKNV